MKPVTIFNQKVRGADLLVIDTNNNKLVGTFKSNKLSDAVICAKKYSNKNGIPVDYGY